MREPPVTGRATRPSRLTRRRFLGTAAMLGATASLGRPASVTSASTPPAYLPSSSPTIQALDDALAALGEPVRAVMARAHVPGAAVGVLLDGQEASAGFGVTNADYPQPVDRDTLFQIGSITKTYTATAIMRLVEQGRLDLDVPIRRYLPDLRLSDPEVAARVTLRHLLTHTSGLPTDDFRGMGGGDDALARYAAALAEWPLLLPLGFAPSYSNIGFSLAGRVLETVADRSYEAAIQELILDPLEMDRSFFFAEDAILYPTSAGHSVADDEAVVQRPWQLSRTANPAGGLVQSLRDLLRYARFWLGNGTAPDGQRLLLPETMALMQTAQAWAPEDTVTLGLPWPMADLGGDTLLAHDGATPGHFARLWLVPTRGFALCVLTNSLTGDAVLGTVGGWAREHVLGFAVGVITERPTLAFTDDQLAVYAGQYENPGESRYTLSVHDGGLEMVGQLTDPVLLTIQPLLPEPPPLQLAFETPDRVYVADAPSARGTFLRRSDGGIAGLFWEARFYRRLA